MTENLQLSEELLRNFQNRLKVGNRRGVHLNAIPGKTQYKLDLTKFEVIDSNFPSHFLDQLLTSSSFKLPIETTDFSDEVINLSSEKEASISHLVKSIEKLSNQAKAIESDHGINTFGFGFPLLVRKDKKDQKITVAPLLIWTLKIKRSITLNKWIIERKEDAPIYLNEVLKNHLWNDSQISINELSDEVLDDGIVDKSELLQICKEILTAVNGGVSSNIEADLLESLKKIQPIKTKEYFKNAVEFHDSKVHFGGLFSLFKVQKQNLIKDYDELLKLLNSELELGSWDNHSFQSLTSVPTDPSQQGLLNSMQSERNLLIQGPPGTGKSQTLSAILVNALENNKKTLVVCEKRTALEVLEKSLNEKGLGDFCVLIKDSVGDRKTVVGAIRDGLEVLPHVTNRHNGLKTELNNKNTKIARTILNINKHHQAVGKKILEEKNWTDIVGMLLHEDKGQFQEFNLSLSDSLFEFEYQEYVEIRSFLEEAEEKYAIYREKNPQPKWNAKKLIQKDKFASIENLQEDIYHFQSVANDLAEKIEDYKSAYLKIRLAGLEKESMFIEAEMDSIKEINEKYNQQPDFHNQKKTNGWLFGLMAKLSTKKATLLADQQRILSLFNHLEEYSEKFEFLKPPVFSNEIALNISLLYKFWKNLSEKIESEKQRIYAELEYLDVFRDKNMEIEKHLLQGLQNQKNLTDSKVKNDFWLKHYKASPDNETTISFYKNIAIELSEHYDEEESFFAAHDWFNYFKNLEKKKRYLIQSLSSQSNWVKHFSINYLKVLLKKNSSSNLPQSDEEIRRLQKLENNRGNEQINYIKNYWFDKRKVVTNQFNNNGLVKVKNLYNKRSSHKHKRHSLRQIISKDINLFTGYFPIVLTTPDVCSNLFFGHHRYFDIVLFDEASQLRIEDTLPALLKGKQRIIAGDEHQMPPSNFFNKTNDGEFEEEEEEEFDLDYEDYLIACESLLDFGMTLDFQKRYLDFHYRSAHPYLIDFSNHAFYGKRLKPLPNKADYTPITYVNVGGIYSDNCNEAEADIVLSILENNIHPFENGDYPSVGIATFNTKQRNLIISKINERRIQPEYAKFSEIISALEAQQKGELFVKNLENIQGDERDIIILSTTYGKDNNGRFHHRFGPLNHKKGYKLLNVIITRAKYKIYCCTSFPEEHSLNYHHRIAIDGNNRRGILFAYLAYAKAVSDKNEVARQQILKTLSNNCVQKSSLNEIELGQLESIFEEEVYQRLLERYDDNNLKLQYKFAGFRIDIVFESPVVNHPKIAIECDGASYHSSREAYLYDYHRQKILEDSGFVFHRIWSTNWWRNADKEMEKLCSFIDKVLSQSQNKQTGLNIKFNDEIKLLHKATLF